MPEKTTRKSPIAPPKGTRDLYPEDALRKRYVHQAWRDASIRCGFDEIAGPTFETAELYAVKSGEGILAELFQAFSGKSPEELEQVQAQGRAPYAMRPEFTPTLARMYAAKAGSLPRPCKWFTAGPYFRAERPQRGRLREFDQWNVDVIGDDGSSASRALADVEVLGACVSCLQSLGVEPGQAFFVYSDRRMAEAVLRQIGANDEQLPKWLDWIDKVPKNPKHAVQVADEVGIDKLAREFIIEFFFDQKRDSEVYEILEKNPALTPAYLKFQKQILEVPDVAEAIAQIKRASAYSDDFGLHGWGIQHNSIVRGLAYYTGFVFEMIAEGERAVAGGGRYDKLIELMGGPPTPAVGFAMGDVVLSLLLEDLELMPEGRELADAVSRPPASVRPDVFVIGADDEQTDPLVRRLAADLRRGVESTRWSESDERKPWQASRYEPATGGVAPLHARVSYKSTRNLKKLLADGEKQHARFAAVVHGADRVQLRDLDSRRELTPADFAHRGLPEAAAEFSVDPASDVYVGRALG